MSHTATHHHNNFSEELKKVTKTVEVVYIKNIVNR